MRAAICLLPFIAAAAVTPGLSFGAQNPNAQIALDCRSHDDQRDCSSVFTSCADIQYEFGGAGDYDIGIVVYDVTALSGVECTVRYSGLQDGQLVDFRPCTPDVVTWTYPGQLEIVEVWGADCQTPPAGAGVLIGWLHLRGGAGTIDIIPHQPLLRVEVVDCSFQADLIPAARWHAGFVGGAHPEPGYVPPCGSPTSAEGGTWGAVKTLYR